MSAKNTPTDKEQAAGLTSEQKHIRRLSDYLRTTRAPSTQSSRAPEWTPPSAQAESPKTESPKTESPKSEAKSSADREAQRQALQELAQKLTPDILPRPIFGRAINKRAREITLRQIQAAVSYLSDSRADRIDITKPLTFQLYEPASSGEGSQILTSEQRANRVAFDLKDAIEKLKDDRLKVIVLNNQGKRGESPFVLQITLSL